MCYAKLYTCYENFISINTVLFHLSGHVRQDFSVKIPG